MKLQSVQSSPDRFLCESPCTHEIGVNGNLATTLPSNLCKICLSERYKTNIQLTYIELNIPRRAVNAKPIASIDFILTKDKSRLLFFNFSSSLSIFFFNPLSKVSEHVSLIFSTETILKTPMISLTNKLIVPKLKSYVFCFADQSLPSISGTFLFCRLEAM